MRRMLHLFRWEDLLAKAALPAVAIVMLAGVAPAGAGPAAVDAVKIDVAQNAPDRVVIECAVSDFAQETVDINGRAYTRIALANEPVQDHAVGSPELPRLRRDVIIPNDVRMEARVVSSDYYEINGLDIAPSRGIAPSAKTPYAFSDLYQTDAFYPEKPVSLASPYILRDMRGVAVELNAFQYNPVRRVLRVYTSMRVEVVKIGTGEVNLKNRPFRPDDVSLAFHRIYSDHFINYDLEARRTPRGETGDMLIICPDSWLANLQPLVDAQRANRVNTKIVAASSVGDTTRSIKGYIQSSYNKRDLAFVLLVGDSTRVPSAAAIGGTGDEAYTWLDGSDEYPEILIGRLLAGSSAEVDAQVSRAIKPGTVTVTDLEWFTDGHN